jgi:hypothetical protein
VDRYDRQTTMNIVLRFARVIVLMQLHAVCVDGQNGNRTRLVTRLRKSDGARWFYFAHLLSLLSLGVLFAFILKQNTWHLGYQGALL